MREFFRLFYTNMAFAGAVVIIALQAAQIFLGWDATGVGVITTGIAAITGAREFRRRMTE